MSRPMLGRDVRQLALQPGARYLELGCGRGRGVIDAATAYGLAATGVDISRRRLAAAAARSSGRAGTTFVEADCAALPFGEAEFDVVVAHQLLHHVANWRQALHEAGRVLAPEGHFVLTDHVMSKRASRMAQAVTGPRIRFLTMTELESGLAETGFRPVSVSRSRLSFMGTYARVKPPRTERDR